MSRVIIYLEPMLPPVSSDQPEAGGPRKLRFGLASDGVYTAPFVTKGTVVSYTAFPPLPAKAGGIISVALALESPPPDVIRHPAL